jgi:tRNA 2-thiouridine synthesizing protein A
MSRKVVDARGSFCPGPLMELISNMKSAEVGDELEILSTDQGSANEIPECGVWHVVVKKTK